MAWTIQCGTVEKSLADWGIANVQRKLVNNGVDTLTFQVAADFDAADVFSHRASIILRKGRIQNGTNWSGGTQWFMGEITKTPKHYEAGAESHSYQASGPLVWLGEVEYGQTWYQSSSPMVTSHVLLNRSLSTDAQIRAVLEFAIGKGMPAQVGTLEARAAVPITEGRDMTCWEIISSQMRWSPDAVLWVDYTTTPPSINLTRYLNLPEVTAMVTAGALEEADIEPRNDLVVPGVVLNFEKSGEEDGMARMVLSQQRADGHTPPQITGFERGCLVATLDLQGPKITHQTATIQTALVEANHADPTRKLNWWRRRESWLRSARASNVQVGSVIFYHSHWVLGDSTFLAGQWAKRTESQSSGMVTTYWKALHDLTNYQGDPANDPVNWEEDTAHDEEGIYYVNAVVDWSTYPRQRELIDGVWGAWLEEQGFSIEKITAITTVFYTATDSDGTIHDGRQDIQAEFLATDAPTGEYTSIASYEEGETEPAGLAQFLYETHSVLHYSGRIRLTEEECEGGVRPGNRLNLAGGTGRYASMKAVVQSAVEHLDTGTSEVTFGPPKWLGAGDLLEWLRAWRTRRVYTAPSQQDDGKLGNDGRVTTGRLAPSRGSSSGGVTSTKQKMVSGSTAVELDPAAGIIKISGANNTKITLDLALCSGKELIPREYSYCDNGVVKKVLLIGSEVYT